MGFVVHHYDDERTKQISSAVVE